MKTATIPLAACGLLATSCLGSSTIAGQFGIGRHSGFEASFGYGFYGFSYGGYGYGDAAQPAGRSAVASPSVVSPSAPSAGGRGGSGSGGGSESGGGTGASAKPASLTASSSAQNRASTCAGPIVFSWSGTAHEGFGGSYADVCSASETTGRRRF